MQLATKFNVVGKSFFVHNRIENIKEVAGMIQRLVPDAKIGIGTWTIRWKKTRANHVSFYKWRI